jgi:hypothetical protein
MPPRLPVCLVSARRLRNAPFAARFGVGDAFPAILSKGSWSSMWTLFDKPTTLRSDFRR